MTVYLNELSLYGGDNDEKSWERFTKFHNIVVRMRKSGINRIVASPEIYNMNICGFNLYNYTHDVDYTLKIDKNSKQLLVDFMSKLEFDDNLSCHSFSLYENSCFLSTIAAEAFLNDSPIISVTFSPFFERDSISGFLYEAGILKKKCELNNIFEDKPDNFKLFRIKGKIKGVDPLKNPLWNQSASKGFMLLVKDNFDKRVNGSNNEKIAALIEYGTVIAQLNGWKYSQTLSERNSTNQKKRVIFKSYSFCDQYAYLCIDLKNKGLCFELCDRHGNWIDEYGWDGKVSKGQNSTQAQRKKQEMRHRISV